jgi:hypothetical protein
MAGRAIYEALWNANVPPKICIFAWKLATNGLATQDKRNRRSLSVSSRCEVCGNSEETGHHAVITCTKVAALWTEMQQEWLLSDEQQLRDTGPDWLPVLLSTLDQECKAKVLLIMWRGWFLWNDIIFEKGRETISGSTKFLMSYNETINELSKRGKREADDKGKAVMHGEPNKAQTRRGTTEGNRN